MTIFQLTAGRNNEVKSQVHLYELLTPTSARVAAMIAFGHTNCVTVSDGEKAYRLNGDRARKVKLED